MNKNHSDGLVVIRVQWQEKATNAWLLREVFDLLLRDPIESHAGRGADLTQKELAPTIEVHAVLDEEGGEP